MYKEAIIRRERTPITVPGGPSIEDIRNIRRGDRSATDFVNGVARVSGKLLPCTCIGGIFAVSTAVGCAPESPKTAIVEPQEPGASQPGQPTFTTEPIATAQPTRSPETAKTATAKLPESTKILTATEKLAVPTATEGATARPPFASTTPEQVVKPESQENQLAKIAPDLPFTNKEIVGDTVVWRAQKDNPYGVKENEKIGFLTQNDVVKVVKDGANSIDNKDNLSTAYTPALKAEVLEYLARKEGALVVIPFLKSEGEVFGEIIIGGVSARNKMTGGTNTFIAFQTKAGIRLGVPFLCKEDKYLSGLSMGRDVSIYPASFWKAQGNTFSSPLTLEQKRDFLKFDVAVGSITSQEFSAKPGKQIILKEGPLFTSADEIMITQKAVELKVSKMKPNAFIYLSGTHDTQRVPISLSDMLSIKKDGREFFPIAWDGRERTTK